MPHRNPPIPQQRHAAPAFIPSSNPELPLQSTPIRSHRSYFCCPLTTSAGEHRLQPGFHPHQPHPHRAVTAYRLGYQDITATSATRKTVCTPGFQSHVGALGRSSPPLGSFGAGLVAVFLPRDYSPPPRFPRVEQQLEGFRKGTNNRVTWASAFPAVFWGARTRSSTPHRIPRQQDHGGDTLPKRYVYLQRHRDN